MYTTEAKKHSNGNSVASLAAFLSGIQADPIQLDQVRSFFGYLRAAPLSPNRLARYEKLFELAPQAYVVTDEKGMIQDANATAVEVFGIDLDALVGLELSALLPADKFVFRLFPEEETAPAARVSQVELELELEQKPRFYFQGSVAQTYDPQTNRLVFLWLFEHNRFTFEPRQT